MTKNCAVLIPALNPPDRLIPYLNQLKIHGFEQIILVNDGSAPARRELFSKAEALGCTLLSHEKHLGKGAALKTGMTWYQAHLAGTCDGIITVNSDGQDSIGDIEKVALALHQERQSNTASLVITVRDFSSPGMEKANQIGNKISRSICNILLGIQVSDMQSTLRGIPDIRVSGCLNIPGKHYEYETAVLIDDEKAGYIEIPVQAPVPDPGDERHYRPVRDTFQIYLVILRKFLLFALVSIFVSVLDIFLFWVFETYTFRSVIYPIIWSTVLARIISASINYIINRYVVFQSDADHKKTASMFVILSIVQCLLSAVLVHVLELLSSGNPVFLKVVVDTMLFFVNYKIQHKFIFTREGSSKSHSEISS
ncbi:MAG: GtrA family protein [Lachnospiraceae bacterium]|nr:GtrA family protein [Lachnospiraceae bacterium]MDD3797177.1 GtrA family protein [Lachnospiraceae bacterium]